MKEIIIDCASIETPRQLHEQLATLLHFPEYYGKNLDALFDCLSELDTPTHLILANFGNLGPFSRGFGRVLIDSAAGNPNLIVSFQ